MTFTPGIYPIYKPLGITSHDVIYQLRRLTGIQKIGHAGTLDPLASGVLVVAIGREYTKQIDQLMNGEKEYVAGIKLGVTSTTDDEEGEKSEQIVSRIPSIEEVKQVIKKWIGQVEQTPPIYSAIKINGQPAHRRVRKGQEVTLQARHINIQDIEILKYEWPILEINVRCDKGVYIRSLARDIGKDLTVGGYLIKLERTRVGKYTLADSIHLS